MAVEIGILAPLTPTHEQGFTMADWQKMGRFTTGPRRNQTRFINLEASTSYDLTMVFN